MMRKLVLILFLAGQVWAQKDPTLYVASLSGLSLRESPSIESKRIKLLDYGTAIDKYSYVDNTWIKIDGYNGRWIKTSTLDGKTGYVFDGYTLPLPVPDGKDLRDYFKSTFGTIKLKDSIRIGEDDEIFTFKHIDHYENGVIYISTSMYESYSETLLNLNLTVEKAYLWYYLLEDKFMDKHHLLSRINYPAKELQNDTLGIKMLNYPCPDLFIERADGAVYYVKITWFGGGISIEWGAGV